MHDTLIVNRDGDSVTLTLNRPDKLNALCPELVEALIEAIQLAHADGHVRLIAFRGMGRNFCAGFDLGNLGQETDASLLLRLVRIETLLQLIAYSRCMTVAYAHGKNFGAGVDLFAVCKRRYATSDAKFRMPGLLFDLVLGTRRFAALVGAERAREILQTVREISADEASQIGLVSRITEQDDWTAIFARDLKEVAMLSYRAQQSLYTAVHQSTADIDMAALVRSAAEPGLRRRIEQYLGR
ncbi:enoyl-CoA hydratase/isomerase family protein [Cupriavidus sp. L7L]|uniref:enoyl-CoA hydratase/isomerase family protein n=1 Tax=Cupriavidus sp. L7L TaxID=2546443 RepID=UPI0010564751|nr:enoyl-CoA hydratase/isomerase family protein [Cupriavidus sp. L7L]TDF62291.1 enoyl-CoA hydratase/isomerase family protein [Cupriavidus sp. L7L]